MSNRKVMIICLIVGLIKKLYYEMSQYFLKSYEPFRLVYLIMQQKKQAKGVDTSKLAVKSDLATLKAGIDKIDVEKSKAVPADFSKLRNWANNEVVKESVNTGGFVLKTKYNADKSDLKNKISDAAKKYLILVCLLKKQVIMLKLLK